MKIKDARTINNSSGAIKFQYIRKKCENCHLGQKKLLFSEIEFITNVSRYTKLSKCLVVYIGAALGDHITILDKLFPELNFILYDFQTISVTPKKNIIVIDGKNGYFTDNTISQVLNFKKKINKMYLLFISDIRRQQSVTNEAELWKDMINQQRWGIKMQADFMLLKFRLPWLNKYIKDDYLNYKTDLRYFYYNYNSKCEYGNVLYLDGDIYTQLYSQPRSTECRLFVKKINNTYVFKEYNCYDYEDKLLYYNIKTRDKKAKFKKSYMLPYYLIGYNNNYECVMEYCIIYQYLKYYKRDLKHYNKNIINLLYKISFTWSSYLYNKFNMYCLFYSFMDYIKSIKLVKKSNELISRIDLDLINFKKNFLNLDKIIIESISKNKNSEDKYNLMLNKLKNVDIKLLFNREKYNLISFENNKINIHHNDIDKINSILITLIS